MALDFTGQNNGFTDCHFEVIELGFGQNNGFELCFIGYKGLGCFGYAVIRVGIVAFGRFQPFSNEFDRGTNSTIAAEQGLDLKSFYGVIIPSDVKFEASPSLQAVDGAVFPNRGQGRQDKDKTVLALKEHFGNTGSATEIAVDLEGRMGAEHIGVGATFELVLEEFVGVVAVQQAELANLHGRHLSKSVAQGVGKGFGTGVEQAFDAAVQDFGGGQDV